MKIKPESIVLIVILAVTLFLAGSLITHHGIKTILVPAIVCGIILLLGAVQLSKELIASAKTASVSIDSSKKVDEEAKQANIRYLLGISWLLGYAITIYLIGFIYGTFLFLLLVFRFYGKRSWFKSGMIAILGTAVFWLSFVYFLQTDLWGGVIINLLNLHLPI
jgi:hypothetical protein